MSKSFRIAITLFSLAACTYLLLHQEYTRTLQSVSLLYLSIIFCLKFFVSLLNAIKFKLSTEIFGIHLKPSEWNGLCYISTFYSYFMPARMGNFIRAGYLKKKYKFQFIRFITLLLGANYIDVFLTCIFGFLASVALLLPKTSLTPWIPGTFLAILFSLLLFIPFSRWGVMHLTWPKTTFIAGLMKDFQESILLFQSHPNLVFKFGILSILSILLRSVVLLFCFYAFDVYPNFGLVIIAVCLVNFTELFSFTPGNLGITEGTLAATFFAVGLPISTSLVAIALSRLTSMVIQAILGVLFTYILTGRPLVSEYEISEP